MLEHHSPFDLLRNAQTEFVVNGRDVGGVPVSGTGLLLLQCASELALQEALTSEIELPLPGPQQASNARGCALLWLCPAEWLLELSASAIDSVQRAITRRLATSLAAVTDMTDAFACYEVSGSRSAETLMCGCSLDLRTHAFPAGRVARTMLADVPAIIWNPGNPDRFRCLVDRSFAIHLWTWIRESSRSC